MVAWKRVALFRQAGYRIAKHLPELRVRGQRFGQQDNHLQMRLIQKRCIRQPPDRFEGRIEQLQAPIRSKHSDAFVQVIERLPLAFDQTMVLTLKRKLFRHIVEQESDAAIAAAIGDDMHGPAVWTVP